jgi:thioesterase domain-containing protein
VLNNSSIDSGALSAEEKRRLLGDLLRQRSSRPRDRRLSIGQERLYRLARLSPEVPLYNVAVCYRLHGPIEVAAIEQSVRQIEQRHDVLRTTFPEVGGEPVQRIAPSDARSETFVRIDFEAAAEQERTLQVRQAMEAEVKRSIDLAKGPLWRMALLCVSDHEHFIVLTMHHLVTDGWSFELFVKELATFYASFANASANPLERLPLQYADYADRQTETFESPDFEGQLRYWREQLASPIPPPSLPWVRGLPSQVDRGAESFPFVLSRELTASLTSLSQREDASLFMTLLAGFGALLGRSTRQEDLLLCVPVTGRHRAQSRELIGYFNNILPLRLDMSGDPSLLELLRRARRVALDAYKNQDVPFQWNAELPGLRHIPLSRLLFSLDMEWPPGLKLAGLACESIAVDTGAADFDLSVSMWVSDGRIQGNLRFKKAAFDNTAAAGLVQRYQMFLTRLVESPEAALSTLPLVELASERPSSRNEEGIDGDGDGDPVANWPRSALELRLAREWEDILEMRPISIRADLQSLGASSLAVATLAERIQQVFHTNLPVGAIFQAGTIERMAAVLQSNDSSLTSSPLAPIQARGTKRPLFLCEGVGIYYPLVPHLGDDRPIYGLVTDVVANYPSVEALASHYLASVLETQPDGPYLLGGVSFGGLVAFEIAQQLHAMGRQVGLLALMDTPGPDAYRPHPPIRRILGHGGNLLRYGLPYVRAKLERRARAAQEREPGRESSEAKSTPRRAAADDHLRRVFRRTAASYAVKPYAGRITLFSLSQRGGMRDSLFDPALGKIDPLLGWGRVAAGGVDRHEVAGDHLSILREPFVAALGEQLRLHLDCA